MSPDLFHGLNQRLPGTCFPHTVVTFHDLFVLTGDYSTAEFRRTFARRARETAARAGRIICVSRYTADCVRDLLGVEEERLRVVHHGNRFAGSSIAPVQREPVVLHVGAIQKRKNLAMLVRAFTRAAPAGWRLVLVGGDGFGAAEVRQRIADSPARDRIETPGWLPDEQLVDWYRRAGVLAFPSLDEGFGIPVLEAMAHGLPVLASDRGALPEVCGAAAWIVEASEEEAWVEALGTLCRDHALRKEFGERGITHASGFPWEKAVRSTWECYRELLGGRLSG
jgi:glycosyltransferase involved in cell wall biosynthesis